MKPRRRLSDQERVLRAMPEKQWMAQVVETLEWLGFLVYHPYDSRRDNPGFLDIWAVGKAGGPNEGRLIVIETKTETGQLTSDQLAWLVSLERVKTVEVMAARPRDVDRVMALLSGGEG